VFKYLVVGYSEVPALLCLQFVRWLPFYLTFCILCCVCSVYWCFTCHYRWCGRWSMHPPCL